MKKYAIVKISNKKKIICNIELINMWTELLTKLCVLLIFQILRHNDVKAISYWTYKFRIEIRVSNIVCMVNFNS